MSVNNKDLDIWIENNFNVLFRGKHGVGKTATVTSAFERHNLNWKYFSAATMDPWVDFVGIPRAVDDENGGKKIELVRPADFSAGKVEALFMDELNRAPSKVRNAVMELIQFRSINGIPFPNLRFIWAAVNPDDEEEADTRYDVEALDPAQKDRFQIIVDLPYKPNAAFFRTTYGVEGEAAVEWWNKLSKDAKEEVSPRRLEYALKVHSAGGSLRHVLVGNGINLKSLLQRLDIGPISKKLKELVDADKDTREKEFADINFVTNALGEIVRNDRYINNFIEYVPKDMVCDILEKGDAKAIRVASNAPDEYINPMLESLATSGTLGKMKMNKLKKAFSDIPAFRNALAAQNEIQNSKNSSQNGTLEDALIRAINQTLHPNSNTNDRINAVFNIRNSLQANTLTIRHEDLVLTAVFMAAIAKRSQKNTISISSNGYSSAFALHLEKLESEFLQCASNLNIQPSDVAHKAETDLCTTNTKRMYFSNRKIMPWNRTTDFVKTKDRFTWWP